MKMLVTFSHNVFFSFTIYGLKMLLGPLWLSGKVYDSNQGVLGSNYTVSYGFFSSPEHEVFRVSYCDSALSTFCLVYALEATFSVQ